MNAADRITGSPPAPSGRDSSDGKQRIVHRDLHATIEGGDQVVGQEFRFRSRPDLLDAATTGIERFDSFDRPSTDGAEESKTPFDEPTSGPVDENVDPTLDVGISRKSTPTFTPVHFDLVDQFVRLGQSRALDGTR